MIRKERVPHAAKPLATAMLLLSLLGAAGCMTWHRPVTSAADDVEGVIDPAISPGEQANDKCEQFGCLP